jgi:hypothetical protein
VNVTTGNINSGTQKPTNSAGSEKSSKSFYRWFAIIENALSSRKLLEAEVKAAILPIQQNLSRRTEPKEKISLKK